MKEYKYQGETFLLDDSKGCYVEVTYDKVPDRVGIIAVALRGTKEKPYVRMTMHRGATNDRLTPNGVDEEGHGSYESILGQVCSRLINAHREREAKEQFNPEEACHALHEAVSKLPDA